jgi:hypothetical protein
MIDGPTFDTLVVLFLLGLYLLVGYVLYRTKFPGGFMPGARDENQDRILRTGRRRILPLPDDQDE